MAAPKLSLPKSVRLDPSLEKKVIRYLKANTELLTFSKLINLALEKFVSEPQTIELTPISDDEFLDAGSKAFKAHKDAMDRLK